MNSATSNQHTRSRLALGQFRHRIGPRLAAMFIVVALIPMVVVALMTYQRASDGLSDLGLSKVEQEAALHAKDTTTFLEQFSSEVLTFSSSPSVRGIIRARDNDGIDPVSRESYENWVHRLTQVFVTTARTKQLYQQLLFVNEDGDEIVRVDYRDG